MLGLEVSRRVLGGRKSEARRRILLGCLFNSDENVRWRQLFFVRTDEKIILGQSVGKIIIIIPGFGSEFVDSGFQKYPLANNISAFVKGESNQVTLLQLKLKSGCNKNMPTQVTYESNHIFLFLDSMTSRVLIFLLSIFL